MSAVIDRAPCDCASIGKPAELWQCPHFRIFFGDRRLTSVGRIVSQSFPLDPSIPPAVLESARERGSQVDALFGLYVLGKLKAFPAGTRQDSMALFEKAADWYDKQRFAKVEVQVLLGCEDHGGVLDFRFDGVPLDLKATYNIEQSARMQVAGYSCLSMPPTSNAQGGLILHVTERFREARVVPLAVEDFDDWRTILSHWRMVARRRKTSDG